jgi:hypothetical protein
MSAPDTNEKEASVCNWALPVTTISPVAMIAPVPVTAPVTVRFPGTYRVPLTIVMLPSMRRSPLEQFVPMSLRSPVDDVTVEQLPGFKDDGSGPAGRATSSVRSPAPRNR